MTQPLPVEQSLVYGMSALAAELCSQAWSVKESCSRCEVLYVHTGLIYISSNKLFFAIMSQQDP